MKPQLIKSEGPLDRARAALADVSSSPKVRPLLGDLAAGAIAALVILAYDLSYAALLFQGELQPGVPQALWALLVSAAIVGIWIGLRTTLPPLALAMDTPAMAVLVVLSASVAADIRAIGGTPAQGISHVLLAIWLTSLLSSVCLWLLGAFRLGPYFRFVPYSVVGGFLAATGVLLLAGGLSLVLGHRVTLATLKEPIAQPVVVRLLVAVTLALTLLFLRNRIKSSLLVPIVFVVACIAVKLLWIAGVFTGPTQGWYLTGLDSMRPWFPLQELRAPSINRGILLSHVPQMLAVTAVIIISNVVKLSGLEITRSRVADLDSEFRTNGVSNLAVAAVGGFATSFIVSISRLLTEAGGRSRWSGIFAAGIVGLVVATKFDLASLAPVPVLAGLIMYLGVVLATDSLRRPWTQRAWLDLALCLGIMLICVWKGYIPGVLAGFVLSCILFAYNYGRLGLVRRHATGASIPSNVERSGDLAKVLRAEGDAIHIYWVSGYMFFGSSDRLFEEVRRDIEQQPSPPVRFVVLDCAGVSGADASAIMSLVKLKNFAERGSVALVFAGLKPDMRAQLDRDAFFGAKSAHRAFASRNDALAWCESQLLETVDKTAKSATDGDFSAWLARQLGPGVAGADVLAYFERKAVTKGSVLYKQGDAAATIDLIASGSVAIMLQPPAPAPEMRIRTMATRTVLGEMGFFRNKARVASVIADEDSVLYTLTRSGLERLQKDKPALASAFLTFIIRTLADRVDYANKEIAALL